MASLGHVAVGMAAARFRTGQRQEPASIRTLGVAMLGWSALSVLPDLDVVGFRYGIRYADTWGHRGATHSLVFALGVGLIVGFAARRQAIGLLAALVVSSHAALDALTDGGMGCALLWPFTDTRYFAPLNPIPVAPIGAAFVSTRGLSVVATEALIFAPLLLYALFPNLCRLVARYSKDILARRRT